jgi:hypothetical protein
MLSCIAFHSNFVGIRRLKGKRPERERERPERERERAGERKREAERVGSTEPESVQARDKGKERARAYEMH